MILCHLRDIRGELDEREGAAEKGKQKGGRERRKEGRNRIPTPEQQQQRDKCQINDGAGRWLSGQAPAFIV